jgi:hypothetical protein
MHPTLLPRPFHHDGWVYEEKIDGYRMVAIKAGGVMKADVGPQPGFGYRVLVKCDCGTGFKRRVTPRGAEDDLLWSALLAFDN